MGNTFKTAFLLVGMTLLLMFIGGYFGGQRGMLTALIIAGVMNFGAYFFSDKIALASYRAQPVAREQLPRVYQVVERLTQKAGLPMPKIYVIPTDSPNAFATGRNPRHASVAVSRSREYQADESGAHLTGNPYALASALSKLDAYSKRLPMVATPSTAHLFIIQPLLGMNMGNLFSTHPPIAKRIERLTGRPEMLQ